MAADGNITFSTALDNSELEKQIKETEARIERLKKEIEQRTNDRNAIADAMKAADVAISETEANIEKLKARYAELNSMKDSGELAPDLADARMEVVSQELDAQTRKYHEQLDAGAQMAEIWNKNEVDIAKMNGQLSTATARSKQLGAEYAKSYGTATSNFAKGVESMNKRFDAFMGKITKRVKKLFVFSFIFGALSSLKKYIMSSVQSSEQFTQAATNLKAVLAGIATPILNVVIPALTAVVNVISTVLITLARLVDSIFKTNFVGSIQNAQSQAAAAAQAEEAQEAATDATDADTKATKKNAKAKKEAARWLAAFDELNLAQAKENNDDDSPLDSVGGAGSPGAAGASTPTWDGIDVGKIDAKLAEIMIILGAALLAVGAILCFSGVNIPLGLALMVVGAALIYTAVQEQWDKLPQEVRDAINAALIITGIVLIVLGVIIAFATGNVPLGVGMIIAGALLLWTAVAINWESMPEEVKNVVTVLMGILGAALLVIGIILTLSGAGVPIGIALIILGAATLAGVAAINWERMPEDIKKAVTTIMVIVGTALLVLGAILTFTGANIPLGVGLIAAGAIALVSAAALNWEKLPQETKNAISVIAGIVGAALIVLGVILCITGVGIPFGIALILAGVASIITAAAVNWDAIVDNVKEVWAKIKAFWDTHISKVFTKEFWADKFKSLVNGMISMLNEGLNSFGGFINDLGGGLSDILDFFGVEGYHFEIGMPQIPYLAQGAVIPPNRRFMAVLGDQSNGRNLEAPENLIRQIVREESGNAQLLAVVAQILQAVQDGQVIQCDGYTLATVVNKQNAISRNVFGVG